MEDNCPCCEKRCPAEDLHCLKGRTHFGIEKKPHREHPATPDGKSIDLLRRCGHFLHHNVDRDGDVKPLLDALTPEECAELERLLEKCLASWQNLGEDAPKSAITEHGERQAACPKFHK